MIDRNCNYSLDFTDGGWDYKLVIIPAHPRGYSAMSSKTLNHLAVNNLSELVQKFLDDKLPKGSVASDSAKIEFDMRYVSPDLYNILLNPLLELDNTSPAIWDEVIKLTNVFQLFCDFGTGTLKQIFIGAQKPTLVNKLKITMESMICTIEVNHLVQTILENIKPDWIVSALYDYVTHNEYDAYGYRNHIKTYRTVELAWTEGGKKRIIIQEPEFEYEPSVTDNA